MARALPPAKSDQEVECCAYFAACAQDEELGGNIIAMRESVAGAITSVPFPVFLNPLSHDLLQQSVVQGLIGRELNGAL